MVRLQLESLWTYISILRLGFAPASWQRFTCESPSPHGSLLQDAQVCLAGPFVQPCWWWQPSKENGETVLWKCAAPEETQVKFTRDSCWKVMSGLRPPHPGTSTLLNNFTSIGYCVCQHAHFCLVMLIKAFVTGGKDKVFTTQLPVQADMISWYLMAFFY